MSRGLPSLLSSLALALAAGAAQPNILLIIADDFGVDSSSLYNTTGTGASLPPTPNIVSLAQRGVLFRNAYANPVCSPTRACLLTGRHSFRTGIGDVVVNASSPVLTAAEFTLPEAFAANAALGYQLAHFGKWHLNNVVTSPNSIGGWPHYAGNVLGAITNYTNWSKTVNGVSSTSTQYATTDLVDDAVAWIQAQGASPWFAWVAFNAPHTPFHKPPASLSPHYTTLTGTQADINANPRPYYEAATEAMDTEIGRLLAAVNPANTHVIFLGDNGTPNQVLQPPFPSGRGKDSLYEGGIHVPFIIAGPAVVNPGRTNNTLVNAVDVFATILELAGVNVAATLPSGATNDSRSLLPVLQADTNLTRYAYVEQFGANVAASDGGRALRNGQFKLIRFNDQRQELYDLASDPFEGTNLIASALPAAARSNYNALTLRLADYQNTAASPAASSVGAANSQFTVTVPFTTNLNYSLWRTTVFTDLAWLPVTNAILVTNSFTTVTLTDTSAAGPFYFYRAVAASP